MHYKPTDSHSYLLYSSSHPSHVKNSIPYSQLLRLRRLCSEDSDFSLKSEEMCHFFDKRGYPASVVQAGHHRAQQIDRQSALQTSQKENNNRIPFTLTFHPHNHAVKSIILKNFKLLQNDPDTGRIFSQPPLISFKRDENIGNFLVRCAFQTSNQPGTFKCARARCKTCPFICNVEKLSGLRPSSDVVLLPCRTKLQFGSTVARQEIYSDSDVVPESNQIQGLLEPRNNSPPNSPRERNLAKNILT